MTKKKPDTLLIIDGHALAYRAFFALPPLTSPNGHPTGAILGFLRMLLGVLRDREPAAVAVVFDGPGPTFRDKLSAAYKATRSPMPPDLRQQIDWLKEFVPLTGLRMLCESGVEADDVIASLARAAEKEARVEILSGDKDLAALVSDRIAMLSPSRDLKGEKVLDPAGVEEKFGVPPSAIGDYLSLVGDSSDNIPGVPGIGAKTAAKLLQKFGTLDNLLAHQDELTARQQQAFTDNAAVLELSRKLVRLKTDLAVAGSSALAEFRLRLAPEPEAVARLLSLGLKSILADLPGAASVAVSAASASFRMPAVELLDRDKLAAYLERLAAAPIAVIDTETTSLDPHAAELVGVSFAGAGLPPAYLPYTSGCRQPLARFLADPAVRRCAHNVKYDHLVLRQAGLSAAGFEFDTMVASYVLDPLRRSHALDQLARELLGHTMIPYESLGEDIRACPVGQLAEYSGEDAAATLALYERFAPQLADKNLDRVYREIDHPLIFVLADMEWQGVQLDTKALAKLAAEFNGELERLEKAVFSEAGEEFNLASTQQLGAVLFEKLGLPAQRKTKTGYSTDADTLEALKGMHPLPAIVLEHRELAKLLGTYVEALPELVSPLTGRLHTSFSQVRTATGRLASSNPNLQNLPVRTERGRAIREAIVAPRGKVLVTADYAQIELRIAAFLSDEPALKEAFARGEDLHAVTAARLAGKQPGEVSAEERRQAKAVNFGILYGQSAFGLARTLGIGRNEAGGIIDRYFAEFPRMKAWIDATIEKARETGAVSTWFGRIRPVPDIQASNRNVREAAERVAINTPVQGTAADILKIAMARAWKRLAALPGTAIILQVHDELVVETERAYAGEVAAILKETMTAIDPFTPHLSVATGSGHDWLAASH